MSLVAIKDEVVKVINSIQNARLGITIAVEAKISDWKNGIIQAQRYRLFSDYSYLALPEEIITAQRADECEYYLKYMHTSILFDRYKKENGKYIRKKENIFTKYLVER